MTENFENIHGFDVAIDTIDENGNIEITITEDTDDIFQGFIVKAKRKLFSHFIFLYFIKAVRLTHGYN